VWDRDPEVLKNLCLVEHDCPFVCVPEHRYVIYFYAVFGVRQVRSTGTFPIRHKQQREKSAKYQVMELSDTFTDILRLAWIQTLQRQVKREKEAATTSPTEPFLTAAFFADTPNKL